MILDWFICSKSKIMKTRRSGNHATRDDSENTLPGDQNKIIEKLDWAQRFDHRAERNELNLISSVTI